MTDLAGWLAILNLIVLVAGSFGGVLAFRSSMANAERAVQERVIVALKDEIEILNRKYARQNSIISTILYALKQRGLKIVIEDDFVTLSEAGGKSSKIMHIQDRTALLDDDETDVS